VSQKTPIRRAVGALAVAALLFTGLVGPVDAAAGEPASPIGTSASQSFPSIPLSANTGEKPQSKVWQHAGSWWAVVPTTQVAPTGTWLWRLGADGDWSNVLHLSSRTDTKADAKRQGDVTHLLLHSASPELVSIEYDPSSGAYKKWSVRPSATPVSLPGSETATIDIDSEGRLWLAADSPPKVNVHRSEYPYTSFSGPTTLVDNITSDDITVVTALPDARMAVMWSNQNEERFGFRVREDSDSPGVWSADEVPAGRSAVPGVGNGMADDHLNVAVATDGTLYAAVKTDYETEGYPKIGLLIRRPGGEWDDLHEVDQEGTRPIVLLNEREGTVQVVYTSREGFNDIVSKTTATRSIRFGSRDTLMSGGLNNATSTKENWVDAVLVMASTPAEAHHAFITEDGDPSAPTAAHGGLVTDEGAAAAGRLEAAHPDGGELTFSVVDAPGSGVVEVTDPATGAFVYTPDAGAYGRDRFTFRASHGGVDSEVATVHVTVLPASGLRGWWAMNDGAGGTVLDGSAMDNHGSVDGNVQWTQGVEGAALLLGGDSYARVANHPSVDITGPITVAAWIRPQTRGTQDLVKKAIHNGVDGFELSLASSGKVFARFNQPTSGNTYRVDSTTSYPTDGTSWMHVVATYDGATIRLYINGEQEAVKSGPASIASNDFDLGIGGEPTGEPTAGRGFTGALDDVRLYSRALSAATVAQLANGPEQG
jgi:large repetitive protein